jgi:hypothetical protein
MCHEVARLRQRLLDTMSAAYVTAQVIDDAYQKNLIMALGTAGAITLSLCDSAATIVHKLLDVPKIHCS